MMARMEQKMMQCRLAADEEIRTAHSQIARLQSEVRKLRTARESETAAFKAQVKELKEESKSYKDQLHEANKAAMEASREHVAELDALRRAEQERIDDLRRSETERRETAVAAERNRADTLLQAEQQRAADRDAAKEDKISSLTEALQDCKEALAKAENDSRALLYEKNTLLKERDQLADKVAELTGTDQLAGLEELRFRSRSLEMQLDLVAKQSEASARGLTVSAQTALLDCEARSRDSLRQLEDEFFYTFILRIGHEELGGLRRAYGQLRCKAEKTVLAYETAIQDMEARLIEQNALLSSRDTALEAARQRFIADVEMEVDRRTSEVGGALHRQIQECQADADAARFSLEAARRDAEQQAMEASARLERAKLEFEQATLDKFSRDSDHLRRSLEDKDREIVEVRRQLAELRARRGITEDKLNRLADEKAQSYNNALKKEHSEALENSTKEKMQLKKMIENLERSRDHRVKEIQSQLEDANRRLGYQQERAEEKLQEELRNQQRHFDKILEQLTQDYETKRLEERRNYEHHLEMLEQKNAQFMSQVREEQNEFRRQTFHQLSSGSARVPPPPPPPPPLPPGPPLLPLHPKEP
eukprot:NODE_657_length_1877_cov_17.506018_g528_i0.p1 GENE.NODE_657_length_1877_cov_17.506018_g528_i0~~NODE_657_length_1877_cov_17.506018_g528_i0.p1  ORF type:complete len:593 (-),score=236.82 NODE_657_length_1877_cov_17.506018_g528_i0:99-1877(-)